jgi:glycosyltransferase involved in cell wall biosynthesis
MKLVSVIIPCYKDSQTLGRAIASVIAQSYPLIEIIVVNDCSPESEEIEAVVLHHPEVRYLCNPANVGLATTRNNGLAFARGEIVAFLDADDEYHPEKIELQVAALEPNTVVTCGWLRIYPDGRSKQLGKAYRIIEDPNYLIYRNTLNGAGLLTSRDLLLQHGGYDPTLRSCEDWDLWLRLLSAGVKVKRIGKPLYYYYFNEIGLSNNLINISKWELEVVARHSARMNYAWRHPHRYRAMVTVYLLRYVMRSELLKDQNFRFQVRQKIKTTDLLNSFLFTRTALLLVARSRVFSLAPLIRRCLYQVGRY